MRARGPWATEANGFRADLRIALGLTQDQVAERLGCSKRTVRCVEFGVFDSRASHVRTLYDLLLGVRSIDEFRGLS